ncbi:hypothetical protein H0H81_011445 [Sphagnurus paluster]|uniref:Uncharacterized protein n=1 Tax=Sphagnurus paluster TaxID=117069 RepID=A0A9P7KHJ8_9AGAR|nr:hypothetical protein H0H81_011445 [Sphagnurus paluster]
MFMRILSAVTALLLFIVQSTSAKSADSTSELDPKCPAGTYSGFEWQFDIPSKKFIEKMGSFHDLDWYFGPLDSTTGTDNTIGATRTGKYSGTTFRERLVEYSLSASGADLTMGVVQDTPGYNIVFQGIEWVSYLERFSVQSICGGRAAHISFTAVYCVTDTDTAYDLYEKLRQGAIGALADKLGARLFAGSCEF